MKGHHRVLCVALALAAPLAAGAQNTQIPDAPGEAVLTEENHDANHIGRLDCEGGATLGTLAWILNIGSNVPALQGKYEILVSNTAPEETGFCRPDASGTNESVITKAVVARYDVDDVPPNGTNEDVPLGAIANALGYECAPAASQTLYMCVHWVSDAGQRLGTASATLTLETFPAPTPIDVRVIGTENGLRVEWDVRDPTALQVESVSYEVVVTGGDRVTPKRDRFRGNSGTITGLTNGVTYDVNVIAFSRGNNPSEPTATLQGTPVPVDDFWEHYVNSGGTDDGGCSTGAAGGGAIAGLVLALATRRRRS